jgi:hypothetical protein
MTFKETNMKTYRGLIFSLAGTLLAALLLLPSAARAQTAATSTTVTTFSIQVSGNASAAKTGLGELVSFSGTVLITTTVVTDPEMPPMVVVSIDGRNVTGVGQKTGTVYRNELEANLTRTFQATDKIQTTFAFFKDAAEGAAASAAIQASKTGVLTLDLAYDTTSMSATSATGSLATL